MSGPYCESCKYFRPMAFNGDFGECDDYAKVIHDRNGNRINTQPEVHTHWTCCNHASETGN